MDFFFFFSGHRRLGKSPSGGGADEANWYRLAGLLILGRILPRDVRISTFCQLNGFSSKPLEVKLLAGEQKATEKR